MKKRYFLLIFTLITRIAEAQLTVQPLANQGAITQLVQNFMLGAGVQVTNITYKGDITASGSFGGTSNIGFSAGVILTSGSASKAVGPNNSANAGTSRDGQGSTSNDGDLAKLVNAPPTDLRDQAILEFDFIATSDTLSFRYVFASEEYPEWVCAKQNDVFGFFITGPNPAGGTYTNQNLAIIPGTTSPVSINTVNPGTKGSSTPPNEDCAAGGLTHANYYVDNANGTSVQYDGFTKPLTASAFVKCGEKYHIKIGIADLIDASFDSGVFLEKGSFKTGGDALKAFAKIAGAVNDSTLMESCSEACITFDRGKLNLIKSEKFKLSMSGTSTNGTDYSLLPPELLFPVGKDTITICFKALADGALEGVEALIINLEKETSGTCDVSGATKMRLLIIDKPKLELTKSKDTTVCKSATVNLTVEAKGGKSPYTYSWSDNGGTKTKATFTPTKTTTYYITAKDACGEEIKDSIKIIITDSIKVTVSGRDASCGFTSGSVWLNPITGGTAPYEKLWSTQPPQTADTIKNLVSGQYKLTITDKNGCTGSATAQIVNSLGMTGKVVNLQDPTCFGKCDGKATIEVKDGTEPYVYKWSKNPNPADTLSKERTNLCKGDYNVTVTDKNGCTFIAQVSLNEPEPLKLDVIASTDSICFGAVDSLTAFPNGGTPGYTVSWNPGGLQGLTVGVNPIITTVYQATVTDKNGCTIAKDYKVNVSPKMEAIISVSPLTCISNSVGLKVWAATTGGFPSYKYTWPAPISKIGTDTVFNVKSGTYSVTVTDLLGCATKDTVTIIIPPPIESVITRVTPTLCEKSCDGTAVVRTTGGVPGYSIKWETPLLQTTDTAKKLCAGSYKVVVTDKNGCADTATADINAPKALKIISLTSTLANVCYGKSSTLTAAVNGGLPSYKFVWNPGKVVGQSATFTPDKTTKYTLTVTDANNCTTTPDTITIGVSQPMVLTVKNMSNKCDSLGGLATVSVKQGMPAYKYLWNSVPAQFSDTLKGASEGTYKVIVTDSIGCKDSSNINILVSAMPRFTFAADTLKGCQPLLVKFKITSSTIKSGGQYKWKFGDDDISKQANPAHTYFTHGCHTVTLTATNPLGCAQTDSVPCMIEVYRKPKAAFTHDPKVVLLLEPVVQFVDQSAYANKLEWNFGDLSKLSNESNPKHTYTIPGINNVVLVATSDMGCTDTASTEIVVKENVLVYIPNAFTPNNNGVNDVFKIYGNGIRNDDFQLLIYDRWGILVFQTNQLNEGWDGKMNRNGELSPQDVYVYIVTYLDEDFKKRTRTGKITLIK